MANRNDGGAERSMKTARGSYQAVVDRAVGLRKRNVRFIQGPVEGYIRWLRL